MDGISVELINLLQHLLPGFVAAWVLYGLTSYPKPSQFERVVQALIFSFIISTLLPFEKQLLFYFGKFYSLGIWDNGSEPLTSTITGVAFGLLSSYFANNDKLYAIARKLGFTKRTAYPSEWFGAFSEKPTYVVLNLVGNRRIIGWPLQWPSDPNAGHFMLTDAAWLTEKGTINLVENESILIAAKDVEIVELLKANQENSHEPKTDESPATQTPTAS